MDKINKPIIWLENNTYFSSVNGVFDEITNEERKASMIPSQSIEIYSKLIKKYPTYPLSFNNRAYQYCKKGEYDRALQDINTAIDMYPGNPQLGLYYCTRAEIYGFMQDEENFYRDLELALQHGFPVWKYTSSAPYVHYNEDQRLLDLLKRYQQQNIQEKGVFYAYKTSNDQESSSDKNNQTISPAKSFYILEISCEPGSFRERLFVIDTDIKFLEQILYCELKGPSGYYKAIVYGQNMKLYIINKGKVESVIDLHPYIKIHLPYIESQEHKVINIRFDSANQPVAQDNLGTIIPDIKSFKWREKIEKTIKKTNAKYFIEEDRYFSSIISIPGFEYKEETLSLDKLPDSLDKEVPDLLEPNEDIDIHIESVTARLQKGIVYEVESGERIEYQEFLKYCKSV